MNCEQIEPWISAYQDGELDVRRSRILQEHLACCSACRALSEEWEAVALELWAGLSRQAAPDTLHARVMRQIPEPEPLPVRGLRRGFWRPPGWLSFGLVPIAAATAWLLLAPHATRPPVLPVDHAHAALAELPAAATIEPVSTARSKPAASSAASSLMKSAPPRNELEKPGAPPRIGRRANPRRRVSQVQTGVSTPGNRATRGPEPRATPEPPAITRPGKPQGTDHPEAEWQHRLRRLRPRRGRYPVAEYPPGRWRPRRTHARLILAARPRQSPAVPDSPSPLSSITVVDYVLPEVQHPLAAPEAETDFVLHPAEATPASATGFNL
jgi:anti-sigma factor RsiW